jgi:hypothetical protein
LLFVHRTCILLRCGKPLAADALLGCFLPRLGRLWQRKRPLFLVYFPLSLFTADLSFGRGCLLASPAWLVGLSAQGSGSGLTRGRWPSRASSGSHPVCFHPSLMLLLSVAAGRKLIAKERTRPKFFAPCPRRRRDGSALDGTSRTGCSRWPIGGARRRGLPMKSRSARSMAAVNTAQRNHTFQQALNDGNPNSWP